MANSGQRNTMTKTIPLHNLIPFKTKEHPPSADTYGIKILAWSEVCKDYILLDAAIVASCPKKYSFWLLDRRSSDRPVKIRREHN